MKRIKSFLTLCLVTVITCTALCGYAVYADELTTTVKSDKEQLSDYAKQIIDFAKSISDDDLDYAIENSYGSNKEMYKSMKTLKETCGKIESYGDSTYTVEDGEYKIEYSVKCEDGDGELEVIYKEISITSSSFSLAEAKKNVYPVSMLFSEKVKNTEASMGKAGLNTLMGLGTVFIILALILFLISLFVHIDGAVASVKRAFTRKKKKTSQAIDDTVARIEQNEEQSEDTDNLALIAVITAAIAMQTGASPDSFVVRKIKRR